VSRRQARFNTGDLIEFTGNDVQHPKPGQEQCIGVVISTSLDGTRADVLWPFPDETGSIYSNVYYCDIKTLREDMSFLNYTRKL